METIKGYLPAIIRYVIMAIAASFATRGWISPEHQTILGENLDVLVGSIVGFLTVAYALWNRPSPKAMEAAKAIDKQLPKKEDVVIKTEGNKPDIIIEAAPKK